MAKRNQNITLDQLEDTLEIFQDESDRACAVLGAAQTEWLLGKAIEHRLPHGAEIANELLYAPNAPLGTFAVRIDLAYALGLIDTETRRDLHVIRDVRNYFAHDLTFHTFEDNKSIQDKCSNLARGRRFAEKYPEPHRTNLLTPRHLFIFTVLDVQDELQVLAKMVDQKSERILMAKPVK